MFLCIGCEWHLKSIDKDGASSFKVERYDIVESTYLTTGSFSALQEMKTSFPEETCMLIEDVLKIGAIDEPDINAKLYVYYKDSTLRNIISDVRRQFSNISDVEKELNKSFIELKKHFPTIDIPRVYTQIGALNQSIIVSNGSIGICLDKYLGANYPLYSKYYSDDQRSTMERRMIVPDCMLFYLLSCFPMPENQACADSLSEHVTDSPSDRLKRFDLFEPPDKVVALAPIFSSNCNNWTSCNLPRTPCRWRWSW